MLEDEEAFATVIMAIVLSNYGAEALSWLPQTLLAELKDDFGAELPPANVSRLVAGQILLTSDDFYKRPPSFVNICNLLAGSEPSELFDKADAVECAWGITEALLLAPPEDDDESPFHPEILRYLSEVVKEEGIVNPPDVLRLAVQHTAVGQSDYSGFDVEDPSAFSAQYGIAADRSAEIEDTLRENLRSMLLQLSQIPGFTADNKSANPSSAVEQLLNLRKSAQ